MAASKGKEESEEIDRGLLKRFLLPRTVFPAVCDMGERALATVQVLSEVQRHEPSAMEVDRETSRNKNTGAQVHQKGIRGEKWRVQLTESAKGQLTESVGVVDVDDDFSWC